MEILKIIFCKRKCTHHHHQSIKGNETSTRYNLCGSNIEWRLHYAVNNFSFLWIQNKIWSYYGLSLNHHGGMGGQLYVVLLNPLTESFTLPLVREVSYHLIDLRTQDKKKVPKGTHLKSWPGLQWWRHNNAFYVSLCSMLYYILLYPRSITLVLLESRR